MASKALSVFGSIRNRLLFGTSALALVPILILSLVLAYAAVRQATDSLHERASNQLRSIMVAKQAEVSSYFNGLADDLAVLARAQQVVETLSTLPTALQALPMEHTGVHIAVDVEDYYRNQFGAEYARRNAGTKPDTRATLSLQSSATLAAQYLYIASNPNPLGQKGALDAANGDHSEYTRLHARFHPFARSIVERYGLYDIFLVDMDGNVVYTFFKEIDFATNLNAGPFTKTGLGEAYANARGLTAGSVHLTDYAPYVPSYEDQAAFLSTPVHVGDQQIGVLVVQIPIDQVNAIMTFNGNWKQVGLGESGEIYLVGADKTPRSISRFMKEDARGFVALMKGLGLDAGALARMTARSSNIGLMPIDTQATREALAGRAGAGIYPDYRNIPVLGTYATLPVINQTWMIASEIDAAEANAPVIALRNRIALTAALTLLALALIALFSALRLAATINRPLTHFAEVIARVAQGDNQARVRLPEHDEIGALAGAFDRMLDERNAVQTRIAKENEKLNSSVVDIMTSVAELANRNLEVKVPVAEDVTGAVADAINMMTRATANALNNVRRISNAVSTASGSVRARSEQVQQVARSASQHASDASVEIQQAAQALRDMGDMARDANRNAERALKATADAMDIVRATVSGISESRDQIRETEKRVKRLGERSQEITSVVNIIGQIAERTSVLALNASMQAVAAGDAGRGFSVVADEVKRLAENARHATQQIGSLVQAIQADTAETIQTMNATIAQIVDISKLADNAGGQMSETRAATERLVGAVRDIANSSQAQSVASATLQKRASELLQSSQLTLSEIEAQRQDTETLTSSAHDLVRTVSEFRLPA